MTNLFGKTIRQQNLMIQSKFRKRQIRRSKLTHQSRAGAKEYFLQSNRKTLDFGTLKPNNPALDFSILTDHFAKGFSERSKSGCRDSRYLWGGDGRPGVEAPRPTLIVKQYCQAKMWFPNWIQWIVMCVGLVVTCILADDPFGEGTEWVGMVFVTIATIFVVWMLEGRRRKSSHDDP